MKAIIQCYTPKELERIARGEQTVKVCKTAPPQSWQYVEPLDK